MPVPEEIRKVKRPRNTIVQDLGGSGENRYAVRARKGYTYREGKKPAPVNGEIIGHIIDFAYVPLPEIRESGACWLSYGDAAFVRSVSSDLFSGLLKVFPSGTAVTIMAAASLKAISPHISGRRLPVRYKNSYVSEYYPGASLSPGDLSKLYEDIGTDLGPVTAFYSGRIAAVSPQHHIAIEEMPVEDGGAGGRMSVMLAYDAESFEPVCASVFPGGGAGFSAYRTFIRDNRIDRGILADDRGFPVRKMKEDLKAYPGLHFVSPLRKNDPRIRDNNMYEYEGVLGGSADPVLFGKKRIRGGNWLYSFRDRHRAAEEEEDFLTKQKRNGSRGIREYKRKAETFGTAVFLSDRNLEPEIVYEIYDKRQLMEEIFDQCGGPEDPGPDGFSAAGREFVNFIAAVIVCRIRNKAEELHLLNDRTCGELMEDLASVLRRTDAPRPPRSDDGYWIHEPASPMDILEKLGLSAPARK